MFDCWADTNTVVNLLLLKGSMSFQTQIGPLQIQQWTVPNEPFKRYELYGDFLILPESFPTLSFHFHLASILSNFHVNVIAQKQPIKSNCMRSPQLNFLYHHPSIVLDDYWCTTKQNGIIFTWKPSYTMFCAGNIHEKERVARFSCTGEVVLDLYAGIGYFTLPYLVHANAARVIAIDMNEASVEALKRNIELNGVSKDRIVVLLGDNASFANKFEGECDRVNLGLLPSSQTGWRLAVLGLRKSGGMLHIHENIKEGYENEFSEFIKKKLEDLWKEIKNEECLVAVNHIQKVKSFAPKVNHLVFDVEISARI